MLSRRSWITEFIGHVLRKGLSAEPDRVFDSASELYPAWGDTDPHVAADSAFGREAGAAVAVPRHSRKRSRRTARLRGFPRPMG